VDGSYEDYPFPVKKKQKQHTGRIGKYKFSFKNKFAKISALFS
jgi:hypothetical protein